MKFQTLASGSKGNCSIVITKETKFLIDIGISYLNLKRKLEKENAYIDKFTGILITHAHNDHIKGLTGVMKHTNLKIFIPKNMYKELREYVPIERIVFLEENNILKDINIEVFKTSHDTECSVGYIITSNNRSLVYITDTGYVNRKYFSKLTGKDIYLIESNHDEEMLMDGPYPYYLKQRVISDRGHLSNETTSSYLTKFVDNNTKYIFLAHISQKNNTVSLAKTTTVSKLKRINQENIKVIVALQDEESMLVEV